jgi:5,10-methylenetetrahydromethanopterin reductase
LPIRFGLGVRTTEPPKKIVELVKTAEKSGFDCVWFPESHLIFYDPFSTMAWCASATSTVKLGTCTANLFSRDTTVLANEVATLDEISQGRVILGIASGNTAVGTRPPSFIRSATENIPRMRKLWAGEEVPIQEMELVSGGKVTKGRMSLGTRRIPVYIAATGPKTLQLAGAIADGVILNVGVTAKLLSAAKENVRIGASKAGRDFDALKLMVWAHSCISENRQLARDMARPIAGALLRRPELLKLVDPGVDSKRALSQLVDKETTPGKDTVHAKDWMHSVNRASKIITDEMVDNYCLVGTPEDLVTRIRDMERQGIHEVAMRPFYTYVPKEWPQEQFQQTIVNHIMPSFL